MKSLSQRLQHSGATTKGVGEAAKGRDCIAKVQKKILQFMHDFSGGCRQLADSPIRSRYSAASNYAKALRRDG